MADSATADIKRAEGLVGQVLAASPRNPLAHFAKGQVLRAQRRFEEAIPEYETAIKSNRNWVGALHPLGQCKLFMGSIEETIPLEEQAIRLSPRDPGCSAFGIHRSGSCICCNRAPTRRSSGKKRRASLNAGTPRRSRQPLICLCPRRRDRTCHRRTRRSPQVEQRRSIYEYRPLEGHRLFRRCRRSAPCSKPRISLACARPECRRNNRHCRFPGAVSGRGKLTGER